MGDTIQVKVPIPREHHRRIKAWAAQLGTTVTALILRTITMAHKDVFNIVGGNGFGTQTALAGTVINVLIPPRTGLHTRLLYLTYLGTGIGHTITMLRPIGQVQTNPSLPSTLNAFQSFARTVAAVAAGGNAITVANQPGSAAHAMQANDLLAIQELDGVTRVYTVQSVSGSGNLTATLTSNLISGVAPAANGLGSAVWCFGGLTTTDPWSGLAHPTLPTNASTQTLIDDATGVSGGFLSSYLPYSPILLQSNNITNAGSFQQVIFGYSASEAPPSIDGRNMW